MPSQHDGKDGAVLCDLRGQRVEFLRTGEKSTEQKTVGIYELDGDTLKLCLQQRLGSQDRPVQLASNKERKYLLIGLKRLQ